MNEIWKDIEGYEGLYQVSSLGRVKSLPKIVTLFHGGTYSTKEKILAIRESGDGYLMAALFDNPQRKDFKVHRLVGKAFLPNDGKEQLNHINGDKHDNRIENLEWVSRSENAKHAYDNYLMVCFWKGKNRDMKNVRLVQCLFTGEVMRIRKAADWLGINTANLYSMLSGRVINWTNFIQYN